MWYKGKLQPTVADAQLHNPYTTMKLYQSSATTSQMTHLKLMQGQVSTDMLRAS